MNKISKIILASSLLGVGAEALEFGGMGNISASMGGAGVALKNSQWALYYNPALLGVDKKSRIAYSFGVHIKETNLLSLASVDYQNLQDTPSNIAGIFDSSATTKAIGGAIGGATPVMRAISSPKDLEASGLFADVLKNINYNGTGLKTDQDVQNFLVNIVTSAGGNADEIKSATDLTGVAEKFKEAVQNNPNAAESLKQNIVEATKKTGGEGADLLAGIVENIDTSNISGLIDLFNEKNPSVDKILEKLGGITLAKGSNPGLDRFIQDVNTIQNALKSNNLDITSQNGLVFQIGGNGPNKRGAIAFGVFGSAFASASAAFDDSHNQIIIESGGKYIEVGVNGNDIKLNNADKTKYENSSLLSPNAQHYIYGQAIALSEVPIGYGQAFSTPIGNFSMGLTAKYIFGMGYSVDKTGSIDSITKSFGDMDLQNASKQSTFGIDLGVLYDVKGFSLGVVAKNINEPAIKVNDNHKIILNSQLRAGIAYEWKILSFAMDMDLKPNHTLSILSPQNQMIGGGMMVDLKYIDFRFGAMSDLKSQTHEGVILTGGINILGFLDLAVQSSLKTTRVASYSVPSYLSVKLGGGFSW
ncbi:conjugal transfer protein TraF [Helicobacter sp. 11S02596-1]|uniref:conjugal transfer protein TraF n=1 Tax=Helicobacter sp. 11S02596-1 TaxID=1476194 RepID=UPI000BA70E29|nr:conjugal transfer protein TraF [Helicobacter sp. 11S02596-1]PAF45031.1 hypothetical protein BJI48_00205 [Helicobacter sp. 11S02596-1]